MTHGVQGNWSGLDVDSCRAIAIALVHWVPCFGLSRYSAWLGRRLQAGPR